MRIQDCLHPKRIFNKYTNEWQYVPCGKCAACLRHSSSVWVNRLDVERKCWKYCVFYTLTYSPEYVPRMVKISDDYIGDLTHLHQAPDKPSPLIFLPDLYNKLDIEESSKLHQFLNSRDEFTYLSVYDSQKFIKRLRKNLQNKIKRTYKDYNEKDYQVRYYHVGEYGSTTFRCHYHGLLFFSSDKEASVIEDVLHKSWKLGIVDASFVSETNSSYVAKYLNCLAGLPEIYKDSAIRPFAIFSKLPPIGTLYFDAEEVRKMYDSASPSMLDTFSNGLSAVDVPLWKTFESRLFPRISYFDRVSHFDRVKLYRASLYFQENYPLVFSASDFAHYMIGHHQAKDFCTGYLHVYDDYINYLADTSSNLYNSIVRWYMVSCRVLTQSFAFDVSIEDYVSQIEKYYYNKDKLKLKRYFAFQSDYAKINDFSTLIGMDRLYLESLLDVPLDLMSFDEILTLQSFGIDLEKFSSGNLSERLEYQSLLLPENTRDYLNLVIDSNIWLKKSTKTKIKNDYLSSHPEFINPFNNFKR